MLMDFSLSIIDKKAKPFDWELEKQLENIFNQEKRN